MELCKQIAGQAVVARGVIAVGVDRGFRLFNEWGMPRQSKSNDSAPKVSVKSNISR